MRINKKDKIKKKEISKNLNQKYFSLGPNLKYNPFSRENSLDFQAKMASKQHSYPEPEKRIYSPTSTISPLPPVTTSDTKTTEHGPTTTGTKLKNVD